MIAASVPSRECCPIGSVSVCASIHKKRVRIPSPVAIRIRTHARDTLVPCCHAQAVMPAMKAAGKGTILVTGATASLRGDG
eukprot:4382037-Pleurochrysis_carterae.AAC.1